MRASILQAIFALLLSYLVKAQDHHVVDSLNMELNSQIHDTTRVNTYLALANQYYLVQPDTAIYLCKLGEKISLQIKFKRGLSSAYGWLGYLLDRQGEIESAISYTRKSIALNKELGNLLDMAIVINNLGLIYNTHGNYTEALKCYHQSLTVFNAIGDEVGRASTLNNIGYIYLHQGNIEKGLEYFHKSLKIEEKLGNQLGVAGGLTNLASIYNNQGEFSKGLEYMLKSLGMFEKTDDKQGTARALNNIGALYRIQGNPEALDYFERSLTLFTEGGFLLGEAEAVHNIGMLHLDQDEIEAALEFIESALEMRKELGYKEGIAQSFQVLAEIHLAEGDILEAKTYGNRSLEISLELGAPAFITMAASVLNHIAQKEGDYKKALEMYELHIQMLDSLNNEKTLKATIRQQTKYEFEKAALVKEQDERQAARIIAEETSRRDNLQYSIILLGLLVLGSLVLGLGKLALPAQVAEGLIFFSFLILFEFILVLADPYIETWSGGAPGIKLLFNAGIAALIFPLHAFFESKLKGRLVRK